MGREPQRSAILTDVDGTLAPIVARPELAEVPERARAALARLSERYGLVGCVSGRQAPEARRLVGVEGVVYAGNHGLEVLWPGAAEPSFHPALRQPEATASFVEQLDGEALAAVGIRVEDKGPIQALHWRGAGDEDGAEARVRAIAGEAVEAGLHPHWGRKVLELRPLAAVGKDAAVRGLLSTPGVPTSSRFFADDAQRRGLAVYAGDDRTDLDAFRGLRSLCEEGELETAICVGVASAEAPVELTEQSDLVVEGPAGWLAVLEALTR